MKKTVLVTGGIGYVGRELVRQLAAQEQTGVHVLDNLACGEHRLNRMNRDSFTLHKCDVRDAAAVKEVMRAVAPEVIFHLAAIHYIPACEAAPGDANSINVAGTVNLLDAAPHGCKFVFASTAAVYKPSPDSHIEVDDAIGPVDIYGYTKLHGENFVRYYHQQQKVRGVIVRLFNVVGPGETNPHLVPAIVRQLGAGTTRIELGNLFPRRDYIDVGDVAQGFRRLGDVESPDGQLVVSNLGTGVTHSVEDVVRSIGMAAGVAIDVVQDATRIRAVDRPMLMASTHNLKALTNWVPTTQLASSMSDTWSNRVADGLS